MIERIFISVDASTGRSTISFAPSGSALPIQREGDASGALALAAARDLVARHPGATIHGPHFHAAPAGKARKRRPPPGR